MMNGGFIKMTEMMVAKETYWVSSMVSRSFTHTTEFLILKLILLPLMLPPVFV